MDFRNGKGEMAQQSHNKMARGPAAAAGEGPAASKLAAKMAHELNNPLDAVLRFVSLAQRKAKAGQYADIERYLTDAQFGLQRMAEVLRDLMDIGRETNEILSKAASGGGVALADLIGRATRTAAALAEQKQVSLVLRSTIEPGLSPTYDLRVAQVLSNLLKNAVEAAPEKTAVRLTASLRDDAGTRMLAIVIEDSGPGIPAELLPQLFTAFVTSKAHGAGFGLGLAISREIAVSLGGSLTLQNRTGDNPSATGCIATLLLPLVPQNTTSNLQQR